MDYKNFSAIYDALCLSEKEVKNQAAVDAILLAKQRVTVMFTKLFPSTLADVVKRPTFDTKVFFPIIAKYPEVLHGNEEKFLHLLDALGRYQKGEKKPKAEYAITMDVFAILNSVLIDDYLWKDPNNRKAVILSAASFSLRSRHASSTPSFFAAIGIRMVCTGATTGGRTSPR